MAQINIKQATDLAAQSNTEQAADEITSVAGSVMPKQQAQAQEQIPAQNQSQSAQQTQLAQLAQPAQSVPQGMSQQQTHLQHINQMLAQAQARENQKHDLLEQVEREIAEDEKRKQFSQTHSVVMSIALGQDGGASGDAEAEANNGVASNGASGANGAVDTPAAVSEGNGDGADSSLSNILANLSLNHSASLQEQSENNYTAAVKLDEHAASANAVNAANAGAAVVASIADAANTANAANVANGDVRNSEDDADATTDVDAAGSKASAVDGNGFVTGGGTGATAGGNSGTGAYASYSTYDSKHNPFHYRSGYKPCYFIYDYGADCYLLDEGSCRLLGIRYTGDWIPESHIKDQLEFTDEEHLLGVLFSKKQGEQIFMPVRIRQGIHKGEHLYMTGSVVQRDNTGIALVVSGYFSQLRTPFWDSVSRIQQNSASFDIDLTKGQIRFGYGFADIVGLANNSLLPKELEVMHRDFVHAEDFFVFKRQREIFNSADNGNYYECVYRLKHMGGYFIWCIDRGLVVERDENGHAMRVIGTTTNIDIVRSNFERLKSTIYQDPLTGLHNRLYLNTRYKYFTLEESQPLTLVYVDISGLKVINDYLDHTKGDELVCLAAQILQEDIILDHEVVRFSGDEFLLIFPNCSTEQCQRVIDRFAANLDRKNLEQEYPLPVYFGFGIATLDEIPNADTFLRCEARADTRLQVYKARHHERIYNHLRAFIEEYTGEKVSFDDKRTLDYIDKNNAAKDGTGTAVVSKAEPENEDADAIAARQEAVAAAMALPEVYIPCESAINQPLTRISLELTSVAENSTCQRDAVQNLDHLCAYVDATHEVEVMDGDRVAAIGDVDPSQQENKFIVPDWVRALKISLGSEQGQNAASATEQRIYRDAAVAFKVGFCSPFADSNLFYHGRDLSVAYTPAYRVQRPIPTVGRFIMVNEFNFHSRTKLITVEGELQLLATCGAGVSAIETDSNVLKQDLDGRVLAAEVAYAQDPSIVSVDFNDTNGLLGVVGFSSLLIDRMQSMGGYIGTSQMVHDVDASRETSVVGASEEVFALEELISPFDLQIGQAIGQRFVVSSLPSDDELSTVEAGEGLDVQLQSQEVFAYAALHELHIGANAAAPEQSPANAAAIAAVAAAEATNTAAVADATNMATAATAGAEASQDDLLQANARQQFYSVQGQLSDYCSSVTGFKRCPPSKAEGKQGTNVESNGQGRMRSSTYLLGYGHKDSMCRFNGDLFFYAMVLEAVERDTNEAIARSNIKAKEISALEEFVVISEKLLGKV